MMATAIGHKDALATREHRGEHHGAVPGASPVGAGAPGGALLRATRPRQWLKNALVFAAPVASGAVLHAGALARTLAALVVFVAASASTYLVNDLADRGADRLHPTKRRRPIASGQVPVRLAAGTAAALGAAALGAAAAALSPALAAVVGAYLAISYSYSAGLKRVPVLELAMVASGFTLRAVAGGLAAGVYLSGWFLVTVSAGAFIVVAGKRAAEQAVLGEDGVAHRRALRAYTPGSLRAVRLAAMSVTVATYVLWVFERAARQMPAERAESLLWFGLSVVPFAMAVAAVELAIARGRGGEPEEIALSDRLLQACAAAWLVLLAIGSYA